jgi:hypothetical protein
MQVPPHEIGVFSQKTMARYLRDCKIFQAKFAHTAASIEKKRHRALAQAKQDTIRRLARLRQALHREGAGSGPANGRSSSSEPGWGWAWALEEGEDPPPSSIVSRRDTEEARKLAEVADQAVLGPDQTLSGNNLWAVVVNFLTVTPGRENHAVLKRRGWGKERASEVDKENEKEKDTAQADGASEEDAGAAGRASAAGSVEVHSTSDSAGSSAKAHRSKSTLARIKLWHRQRMEKNTEAVSNKDVAA